MKFILLLIIFLIEFSTPIFSYVDKTGDELCISTCINFESCSRNGTIYLCDCPANVSQKECINNSVFCSPSQCTICNTTFSLEHAFGYECLCDDEKEFFYCKGQDEIIEMIGIFGEFFGKFIGGLVGGVMVGFFVILILSCGVLCCACFCCIKCCQMIAKSLSGNGTERNSIPMNQVYVPVPNQNYNYPVVNEEKQNFLPNYQPNV